MPRGFKKSVADTEAAYASGQLIDAKRRSFISQPKAIPGECDEAQPHLILYGKEDKGAIRAEIFRRNREANGGINRCWKCQGQVFEWLTEDESELWCAEWDHIRNKSGERCDCPENGRVTCRRCHKERHPQVQFGRTAQPARPAGGEQMAETERTE